MSPSPKLHVNCQPTYKTVLGAFFSLIIINITIIGSIYFGKELFNRDEPTAIISAKEYDDFSTLLGPDNYNIYLNVQDKDYIMFNDPKVFKFTAYNDIITTLSNGTQIFERYSLNILPCINFYDNPYRLTNKTTINLNMFYCLEPNNSKIEGFWGAPRNSYVRIVLEKCQNTTENNFTCLTEEQISARVNGGIFAMFSLNHILDMKSFYKPSIPYLDDIYYSLNIDFSYDLTIGLKPLSFITDSGFILKDENIISTFYSESPLQLIYGKRGSTLAQVIIEGKSLGNKIYRSYTKFQDILTKVGGLIKALTVLGNFIITYTSQLEFINDYINNLELRRHTYNSQFNFNRSLTISPNYFNLKEISPIISYQNASPSPNINSNTIYVVEGQNRKSTNGILENYLSLRQTNKDYSKGKVIKDFVTLLLSCCKNKRVRLYKAIKVHMQRVISIETLFEKLWIIESFMVKLSSESERIVAQNEFFNYLRKGID